MTTTTPISGAADLRAEVAMIDAAMVEMTNITPPLKRSECARLLRAALAAGQATAAKQAPECPSMPETWRVVAHVLGEPILSIGYDSLPGKGELTEAETQAVIGMAQHMLAFVGYGLPPSSFDPDADEATAAQAVVPAGWKLVPTEPTHNMLAAMAECDGWLPGDRDRPGLTSWEDYWRMAIAAAPAQPAAQQPGTAYAALPSHDEHQLAIMEGERNASLDAYSRVVSITSAESRLYERAFTSGWDRRDRLASYGQAPATKQAGDVPESLVLAVDQWFADNIKDSGGCTSQDVRELAELFYDVTHEGGRESVDDALAIVESFGPGIGGLNDAYARQVLLAGEVKRLRGQTPNAERTGELLMCLAVVRELTGTQQKGLDETIDAVRAAVNDQKYQPAQAVPAVNDDLRDRLVSISEAIAYQDDRAAQAMLREILAATQPTAQPAPAQQSNTAYAALERLEYANDALCKLRTDGQYLSMIDSGQQEALAELDAARNSARAILRASHGQAPAQSEVVPECHYGPLRDADAEWGKQLSVYATLPRAADTQQAPAPQQEADNVLGDVVALLRKYRKLCQEVGRGDSAHLDRIEAAAVAVQTITAAPTAQEDALDAAKHCLEMSDPLQGAANWLVTAHSALETSTLAGKLSIGYNRAKRLHDAALAAQGGTKA